MGNAIPVRTDGLEVWCNGEKMEEILDFIMVVYQKTNMKSVIFVLFQNIKIEELERIY